MNLLRTTKLISILILLILVIVACRLMPMLSTEENLSEKDVIITNLKDNNTREQEIARIKGIRRIQISALIQIITDYKEAVIANRSNTNWDSLCPAIELLGELRATEAIDPIIALMSVEFREPKKGDFGGKETDLSLAIEFLACQNALVQIGNTVTPPLINWLKNVQSNPLNTRGWNQFARMTLYRIEGDCAIHRLEKALSEETDKQKKENLVQAIAKMREEIKSGEYIKLLGGETQDTPGNPK